MKKQNRGITLIALVVTIIVLLILAGVSIATLTGENGILTQAENAKSKTTKAAEEEKVKLAIMGSWGTQGKLDLDTLKENLKKEGITSYDAEATEFPLKVEVNGISKEITNIGSIQDHVNIADYIKVGQYVDYEPTKTDVNKTQAVEASKLTYTSPVGGYSSTEGIITHGNGNSEQTLTAKENDGTSSGLKWRVLSVSEDKVELISDTVVQTDANANFILEGGIGYLYAEQELNEACKIYGYGYGADKSVETEYTVGGPEDIPITGKITQSGARSITIEDLNKKAGIEEKDGTMKDRDGNVLDTNYGTTSNLTIAVYYPTLSSSNTTYPSQSTSKKNGFKDTYYSWDESKIEDTNTQSMLFNGDYWLSSRFIATFSSRAVFYVGRVLDNYAGSSTVCYVDNSYWNQSTSSYYAVRPVVTLKSKVIDINTDYEAEGEWKLK